MKELFLQLFRYNFSINRKLISAFNQQEINVPEALRLLCHIYNAQQVWLSRIRPNFVLQIPEIWQVYNIQELTEKLEASEKSWMRFLESLPKIDEVFSEKIIYVNSKGERFENTVRDVLFHLINHGTHHRAQISTLLRQNEIAPPTTDYIFWVREK
jgi:uncharacterized damage-inducible protein DinB